MVGVGAGENHEVAGCPDAFVAVFDAESGSGDAELAILGSEGQAARERGDQFATVHKT